MFRNWRRDYALETARRRAVRRRFLQGELSLRHERKAKADDCVGIQSIVSLDWQKPGTFMVVRDLPAFAAWLAQPKEISLDRLELARGRHLRAELGGPQKPRPKSARKLSNRHFEIVDTLKAPRLLCEVFSQKDALSGFVDFLERLKFKVADCAAQIVEHVLGLELLEERLGDLHNEFKAREPLQDKHVVLNQCSRTEEFESLWNRKSHKKNQPSPLRVSRKINSLLRKISRAKPENRDRTLKTRSQKQHQSPASECKRFKIKSALRMATHAGAKVSQTQAQQAALTEKTSPETSYSPNTSGPQQARTRDKLEDDVKRNLADEQAQTITVQGAKLAPQVVSLKANVD